MLGIGKRELLEDYYHDELVAVFGEYAELRRLPEEQDEVVHVSAEEFMRF